MLKKLAVLAMFASSATLASASQLPDHPFIHASGTAATYVAPDIGEIDFEVSAYDPDPEAARAVVEARLAAIRTLTEERGVPAGDVEARDVRKEMRKGDPNATVPLYDIKCTVHITVRNLANWRAIALPLLNMPNLDSFATEFGASDKEKIETKLMAEAIADARRKAEAMAAGLGRKLGPASAVSSGSLKNLGSAMGLVTADFFGRAGSREQLNRKDFLTIDILKMAQPVDVIFRIK